MQNARLLIKNGDEIFNSKKLGVVRPGELLHFSLLFDSISKQEDLVLDVEGDIDK